MIKLTKKECKIHGIIRKFSVIFTPDINHENFCVGMTFTINSVNRKTGEIQFTDTLECYNDLVSEKEQPMKIGDLVTPINKDIEGLGIIIDSNNFNEVKVLYFSSHDGLKTKWCKYEWLDIVDRAAV